MHEDWGWGFGSFPCAGEPFPLDSWFTTTSEGEINMCIRTLAIGAALSALTFASTVASAQTHTDSLTYQGTLMDAGAPANGSYDISFVVFDAQSGGSEIPGAFTIVPGVQVTDGLFETLVDFGTTGLVFDSTDVRWIELRVRPAGGGGPFDALSPRQRITPAPLSNYALRSGTALQNAYDNGSTIFRGLSDGPIEFRSTGAETARLNLGSAAGDESQGELYIFGETGDPIFEADQDPSGGGRLQISRNDSGSIGFLVDGNAAGMNATQVTIFGAARSIVLSTSASGDQSVEVPVDAINATEILNEPGVAEVSSPGSVLLTISAPVTDVINTVTINCPTDGYVFVIASADLAQNHVQGTTSSTNLGVSHNPTGIPSNGDLTTTIASINPSGVYRHAVTAHSVFQATQGANTFYFLGDTDSAGGFAQVSDIQLSTIFIPTAYGTVVRQGDPDYRDHPSSVSAPMTSYDIVLEQNAALQADTQRQQREIDAMKLQLQTLLEHADQSPEQHPQD